MTPLDEWRAYWNRVVAEAREIRKHLGLCTANMQCKEMPLDGRGYCETHRKAHNDRRRDNQALKRRRNAYRRLERARKRKEKNGLL